LVYTKEEQKQNYEKLITVAITILQLAKVVLSEENRPLLSTEIRKKAVDKWQDPVSTGNTLRASLCAL